MLSAPLRKTSASRLHGRRWLRLLPVASAAPIASATSCVTAPIAAATLIAAVVASAGVFIASTTVVSATASVAAKRAGIVVAAEEAVVEPHAGHRSKQAAQQCRSETAATGPTRSAAAEG